MAAHSLSRQRAGRALRRSRCHTLVASSSRRRDRGRAVRGALIGGGRGGSARDGCARPGGGEQDDGGRAVIGRRGLVGGEAHSAQAEGRGPCSGRGSGPGRLPIAGGWTVHGVWHGGWWLSLAEGPNKWASWIMEMPLFRNGVKSDWRIVLNVRLPVILGG